MTNKELVERYSAGVGKLAASIEGLSDAQLSAFPVPGTWSIRQIVLHLMDSDLVASDRMKRVIAEENPVLIGFDESTFARNLFYDRLDVEAACDLFDQNRRLTAAILRELPEAAFARSGMHNERGRVTLADLVRGMVDHLDHHLKFVEQKRRLVSK